MKKIYSLIMLLPVFAVLFSSCEKSENKVLFEGGTNPVLTASKTGPLVFANTQAASEALKFSWTNPNYMFNTGVSSQNVNYLLEIDTTGANFSNPKKVQVSMGSNLEKVFTVKDLNTLLNVLDLEEKMAHNLEFRIKSTIGSNSVPMYSNVLKIAITPYLDVAVPLPPTGELYITGDATASGWTNSLPASQKFTKVSKTEFTITVPLQGDKYYKFLSTPGQWQPQYGGKDADGGNLGYNMGGGSDPDAIPAKAGTFKITVNFKTGKYTVAKQ